MKVLGKVGIHVDNGGYMFKVQIGETDKELRVPHIVIEDGYFGYSSTTLSFNECVTPENLKQIGLMFLSAAEKLNTEQHYPPMLCFQHGGSKACEDYNKKYNLVCPICKDQKDED